MAQIQVINLYDSIDLLRRDGGDNQQYIIGEYSSDPPVNGFGITTLFFNRHAGVRIKTTCRVPISLGSQKLTQKELEYSAKKILYLVQASVEDLGREIANPLTFNYKTADHCFNILGLESSSQRYLGISLRLETSTGNLRSDVKLTLDAHGNALENILKATAVLCEPSAPISYIIGDKCIKQTM